MLHMFVIMHVDVHRAKTNILNESERIPFTMNKYSNIL